MITCRLQDSLAKLMVIALLVIPAVLNAAATAAPGWAVSTFASGFVNLGPGSYGPIGIAADQTGNIYVQDYVSGGLYKFPPTGGTASPATLVGSNPGFTVFGLTFSKDGRLYATDLGGNMVVELDLSSAAIRVVVSGLTGYGIATDPFSGDLFIAGTNGVIYRISNFSSGPGTVSPYATVRADGLVFGPDGSLYAANAPSVGGSGYIIKIGGTNTSQPASVTVLPGPVPNLDGMAVAISGSILVANGNNGTITAVDLTTFAQTAIVTGGSRGDFATAGKDGCLYATQTDSILKVTASDGTCTPPFTPPPAVSSGRMTGGGSVFTATGVRVTHGFELHCQTSNLPNSLEINWAGHSFHLETLTAAFCFSDPSINARHPTNIFNTYVGTGTGDLDGVPGATVMSTLTDAGEPGTNDMATIRIKDASGNTVLTVNGKLDNGNQQAHAN